MRNFTGLLLLVGAFLTLAGCGKANVVGTWEAKLTDLKPDHAGIGAAVDKLATMSLEFKDDGTCFMTMLVKIPGKYEVSGNRVTVTFPNNDKTGESTKNNNPLILDISSDGKSLVAEKDSTSDGELVFTKQAA